MARTKTLTPFGCSQEMVNQLFKWKAVVILDRLNEEFITFSCQRKMTADQGREKKQFNNQGSFNGGHMSKSATKRLTPKYKHTKKNRVDIKLVRRVTKKKKHHSSSEHLSGGYCALASDLVTEACVNNLGTEMPPENVIGDETVLAMCTLTPNSCKTTLFMESSSKIYSKGKPCHKNSSVQGNSESPEKLTSGGDLKSDSSAIENNLFPAEYRESQQYDIVAEKHGQISKKDESVDFNSSSSVTGVVSPSGEIIKFEHGLLLSNCISGDTSLTDSNIEQNSSVVLKDNKPKLSTSVILDRMIVEKGGAGPGTTEAGHAQKRRNIDFIADDYLLSQNKREKRFTFHQDMIEVKSKFPSKSAIETANSFGNDIASQMSQKQSPTNEQTTTDSLLASNSLKVGTFESSEDLATQSRISQSPSSCISQEGELVVSETTAPMFSSCDVAQTPSNLVNSDSEASDSSEIKLIVGDENSQNITTRISAESDEIVIIGDDDDDDDDVTVIPEFQFIDCSKTVDYFDCSTKLVNVVDENTGDGGVEIVWEAKNTQEVSQMLAKECTSVPTRQIVMPICSVPTSHISSTVDGGDAAQVKHRSIHQSLTARNVANVDTSLSEFSLKSVPSESLLDQIADLTLLVTQGLIEFIHMKKLAIDRTVPQPSSSVQELQVQSERFRVYLSHAHPKVYLLNKKLSKYLTHNVIIKCLFNQINGFMERCRRKHIPKDLFFTLYYSLLGADKDLITFLRQIFSAAHVPETMNNLLSIDADLIKWVKKSLTFEPPSNTSTVNQKKDKLISPSNLPQLQTQNENVPCQEPIVQELDLRNVQNPGPTAVSSINSPDSCAGPIPQPYKPSSNITTLNLRVSNDSQGAVTPTSLTSVPKSSSAISIDRSTSNSSKLVSNNSHVIPHGSGTAQHLSVALQEVSHNCVPQLNAGVTRPSVIQPLVTSSMDVSRSSTNISSSGHTTSSLSSAYCATVSRSSHIPVSDAISGPYLHSMLSSYQISNSQAPGNVANVYQRPITSSSVAQQHSNTSYLAHTFAPSSAHQSVSGHVPLREQLYGSPQIVAPSSTSANQQSQSPSVRPLYNVQGVPNKTVFDIIPDHMNVNSHRSLSQAQTSILSPSLTSQVLQQNQEISRQNLSQANRTRFLSPSTHASVSTQPHVTAHTPRRAVSVAQQIPRSEHNLPQTNMRKENQICSPQTILTGYTITQEQYNAQPSVQSSSPKVVGYKQSEAKLTQYSPRINTPQASACSSQTVHNFVVPTRTQPIAQVSTSVPVNLQNVQTPSLHWQQVRNVNQTQANSPAANITLQDLLSSPVTQIPSAGSSSALTRERRSSIPSQLNSNRLPELTTQRDRQQHQPVEAIRPSPTSESGDTIRKLPLAASNSTLPVIQGFADVNAQSKLLSLYQSTRNRRDIRHLTSGYAPSLAQDTSPRVVTMARNLETVVVSNTVVTQHHPSNKPVTGSLAQPSPPHPPTSHPVSTAPVNSTQATSIAKWPDSPALQHSLVDTQQHYQNSREYAAYHSSSKPIQPVEPVKRSLVGDCIQTSQENPLSISCGPGPHTPYCIYGCRCKLSNNYNKSNMNSGPEQCNANYIGNKQQETTAKLSKQSQMVMSKNLSTHPGITSVTQAMGSNSIQGSRSNSDMTASYRNRSGQPRGSVHTQYTASHLLSSTPGVRFPAGTMTQHLGSATRPQQINVGNTREQSSVEGDKASSAQRYWGWQTHQLNGGCTQLESQGEQVGGAVLSSNQERRHSAVIRTSSSQGTSALGTQQHGNSQGIAFADKLAGGIATRDMSMQSQLNHPTGRQSDSYANWKKQTTSQKLRQAIMEKPLRAPPGPSSQRNVETQQPKVLCNMCSKAAVVMCSGCHNRCYCSEDCQKVDWSMRHEGECARMTVSAA